MDLVRLEAYLPLLTLVLFGVGFVVFLLGPTGLVRALRTSQKKDVTKIERYHVRFFHALIICVLFVILILPLIPISVSIKEFQSIPDIERAGKGLILIFFFCALLFVGLTYATRKGDILWSSNRKHAEILEGTASGNATQRGDAT